jgi:hypothetical protein
MPTKAVECDEMEIQTMAYEGPVTRDAIRDLLKTKWDSPSRETKILLDGERIGRVVTYGKKDMLRVSKTGLRPTVFNGRVTVNGHDFSIEASSTSSMLNALATKISQAVRADKKTSARRDEPSGAPEAARATVPTPKF